MAKSNDIADKVLNIGIVVAVIVGLVYLLRFFKASGGDTLFGSSKIPSSGSGDKPGTEGGLSAIFNKLDAEYKEHIANPTKGTRIALQLEAADVSAKMFWNKPGSNIVINKTLKAVNALPDNEYMDAVTKWLKLAGKDFYDTTLVGAKITTDSHSQFLLRYEALTGKVNYSQAAKQAISLGRGIMGI